jgi:adenylate cyclase
MSKKQDRAWFLCPQWADLIARHYASDAEAARALKTAPKVLAKLRARTPVPKSTVLHCLHALARRHAIDTPVTDLVVDTRSH